MLVEMESNSQYQGRKESTEIPALRLKNINGYYPEKLDRVVVSYAGYLASTFEKFYAVHEQYPNMTPLDFVHTAGFHLDNLEEEKVSGGYPEDLRNLDRQQLELIYLGVPKMAEAAFSKEFATEVGKLWDATLVSQGLKEEMPQKVLKEFPELNKDLNTLDEVKAWIIDDIRETVLRLDWAWAMGRNMSDGKVLFAFDKNIAGVLADDNANSPVRFSEGLLITSSKRVPLLEARQANFLRDWVLTQMLEKIAQTAGGLDSVGGEDVAARFLETNPGVFDSYMRVVKALRQD
jgi:hypothetical protein